MKRLCLALWGAAVLFSLFAAISWVHSFQVSPINEKQNNTTLEFQAESAPIKAITVHHTDEITALFDRADVTLVKKYIAGDIKAYEVTGATQQEAVKLSIRLGELVGKNRVVVLNRYNHEEVWHIVENGQTIWRK